jgi:hypothetical protein
MFKSHADRNLCDIAQFGLEYVTVCPTQRTYVLSGIAWPRLDGRGCYKTISELSKASKWWHFPACGWLGMLHKHPFKKPFPPNRPNQTTKGLNFESLQYALQTILEAHDNYVPPESSEDTVEEEVVEEEDSTPNIFGHFSDSIFQAKFETVHPYNTRSKRQSKPFSEVNNNVPPK